MLNIPKQRPVDNRFSCGPCKKPQGWSPNKYRVELLGRSHFSLAVQDFTIKLLSDIKSFLNIPKNYEIALIPASASGAIEAIIWNVLSGSKKFTIIVNGMFSRRWLQDILKLDLTYDIRESKDFDIMPDLKDIDFSQDIFFVYNETATGFNIGTSWINENRKGLVISDVVSAVLCRDIDWQKIDIGCFSAQKGFGAEGGIGIVAMSPKAVHRLRTSRVPRAIPRIISFYDEQNNFKESMFDGRFLNTPSILSLLDIRVCLDLARKRGGLKANIKACKDNYDFMNNWINGHKKLEFFVNDESHRSAAVITIKFLMKDRTKAKILSERLRKYLSDQKIAYDIRPFLAELYDFRIWIGPTINIDDLKHFTTWFDYALELFGE